MTRTATIATCALAWIVVSAASPGSAEYPEFDDEHLMFGRAVWMGTCENCHGTGVGGAPVAGNRKAWDKRVAKGKPALYEHALEGFFGRMGTMMPPRGGNEDLTDDEVKAAVDYMVELALPRD